MAIEIVDFPINSMVIFHCYVSSPEGIKPSNQVLVIFAIHRWYPYSNARHHCPASTRRDGRLDWNRWPQMSAVKIHGIPCSSQQTHWFSRMFIPKILFFFEYFRGLDPSPVRFTAHLRVKHYFPYSSCHQWVFPTKACRQRVAVSLAKFTELITKVSGLLGCERSSSELRFFFGQIEET